MTIKKKKTDNIVTNWYQVVRIDVPNNVCLYYTFESRSDAMMYSCISMCNNKKNGVLVCAPSSLYKNIGDYVQSVAQEQFLPKTDCYVEREALNSFH